MFTNSIEKYLTEICIPIRLSCLTGSGWPVTLSLWYLYRDQRLYCATQDSAKVVKYLRQDERCAFEVAADAPPYCGVRGQGIATIDKSQGVTILEELLVRYLGGTDNSLAQTLLANSDSEVAIVIEPVNIFDWNFSDRMKDVAPAAGKICP